MHLRGCGACLLAAVTFQIGHSFGDNGATRWIVSTTAGPPTDGLRHLAGLSQWKLLVVGGEGTPAEWSLPGALYLSLESQKKMGFKSQAHAPDDALRRKNVGYLFAIQHGATVIYDADDVTVPRGSNITVLDTSLISTYVVDTSTSLINVYDTYGLEGVWPRGFPIADANRRAPSMFDRQVVRPLIQQGLINNHPDVDAMSCLRDSDPLRRGLMFPDTRFSLALPRGAMCPFNARSTVFLQDAFWALILPGSLSPLMADVWRGFWAQRLLWEIGGSLTFSGPVCESGGNWSTTLDADTAAMGWHNQECARLVTFLKSWKVKGSTLPEAIIALASSLASEKFWAEEDTTLIKAWVEVCPLGLPEHCWMRKPSAIPVSGQLPTIELSENVVDLILPLRYVRLPHVTLIIMYNWEVSIGIVRILQRMYEPIFGQVLHTGFVFSSVYKDAGKAVEGLTWVDCEQHGMKGGIYMQECQAKAMHMYPVSNKGGYLVAADDTLVDVCAISQLPFDKPWVGGRLWEGVWPKGGYGNHWMYGRTFGKNFTQEQALLAAAAGLRDSASVIGYNATLVYGLNATNITRGWGTMTSDVFYIPEWLRTDFIALSMHFVGFHLHTELITAYLMAMLSQGDPKNYVQLYGSWLWGADRSNISMWGLSGTGLTGNRLWVHAVKLSQHARTIAHWWSDLRCQEGELPV